MFFYFKVISILLLPQALPVCTLHIILSSSLWLWIFFVLIFYPKFWAGSLNGIFLECMRYQDLAFTLEHHYLFLPSNFFLYRSRWYATVHRLSRRLWPGTHLQSVLWFWNHKHNMLGIQSCSILQTSISILNGRCSLIHLTALVNNMELRCTLSMDVSHSSLLGKSKKDLTTTQGNLHFIYS